MEVECAMLDGANKKDLVDLERSAVTCNDVRPFAPPGAGAYVDEMLRALGRRTRFALAIETHEPDGGCEYWPVTPPERYSGPWNKTLRNPVLIISNTVCRKCCNGEEFHQVERKLDTYSMTRSRRSPTGNKCIRTWGAILPSWSKMELGYVCVFDRPRPLT